MIVISALSMAVLNAAPVNSELRNKSCQPPKPNSIARCTVIASGNSRPTAYSANAGASQSRLLQRLKDKRVIALRRIAIEKTDDLGCDLEFSRVVAHQLVCLPAGIRTRYTSAV